jgi:hypothetical protein
MVTMEVEYVSQIDAKRYKLSNNLRTSEQRIVVSGHGNNNALCSIALLYGGHYSTIYTHLVAHGLFILHSINYVLPISEQAYNLINGGTHMRMRRMHAASPFTDSPHQHVKQLALAAAASASSAD